MWVINNKCNYSQPIEAKIDRAMSDLQPRQTPGGCQWCAYVQVRKERQ